MSKNYVFLTDGFEMIEALTPVDILRRAGQEVVTVSVTGISEVTGSHKVTIKADTLIEEIADFSDAALLVLPGGPGYKGLEECERLRACILAQYEARRLIAAICAAPAILARLGLLKDKAACCHASVVGELKNNGAQVCNGAVVRDEYIITSKGMGTSLPFALTLAEALCGKKVRNEIEQSVELL